MNKSIRPSARSHAFVRTQIRTFNIDFAKSGATFWVATFLSKKTAPVTIVKPSDWAVMAWATHSVEKILRDMDHATDDTNVNMGFFLCFLTVA